MLLLTRKIGESIVIDDDICVTIKEIRGNNVKIGIEYPATTRVLRKEIFDRIQVENQLAAASSQTLTQLIQGNLKIKSSD